MKLIELLDLRKGGVISIVGAGGKTTFMYTLAEELRNNFKVLVTTTTKVYKPESYMYDYFKAGNISSLNYKYIKEAGIYVYGSSVTEEGKLTGIDPVELERIIPLFDYSLIESDGSKRKSIKGWNTNEPVITKATTKTVGIISIDNLGKVINEQNVHRVDEFLHIINGKENEHITVENLVSIVFHKEGLFKNSLGEKVLFINKVDNYNMLQKTYELVKLIQKENKKSLYIDKILIGSLKNKKYEIPITCKGMI